ncbi:Mpo1-like protein [Curvibacter lanceolatus]|uniref:Mpo1-like protein n=1 Tax=Curvibacter lanceolatus TaxID=86182 RepID=UPI00035E1A59|nr:Mpo1-like protein [Curvibacter lanceolatus]
MPSAHASTTASTASTASTAAPSVDPRQFTRFADFYPFYLGEHSNRTCRRLHFAGSTLSLVCLAMLAFTGRPQYLLYGLLCGYGLAWVGHFVFEKNKPASFKRPLYSFMGDWAMYRDIWLGRVPF